MLLAIDVGNTEVTIGVFDGDVLANHWRAATVAERYLPSLVLAAGMGSATDGIALLEGCAVDVPTAHVCRAYACDAPTDNVAVLAEQLQATTHEGSQLAK